MVLWSFGAPNIKSRFLKSATSLRYFHWLDTVDMLNQWLDPQPAPQNLLKVLGQALGRGLAGYFSLCKTGLGDGMSQIQGHFKGSFRAALR